MEIKKAIKTPNGVVLFQGELSEEEHDFVLTVGINELFQQGALPFMTQEEKSADLATLVIPPNQEVQ